MTAAGTPARANRRPLYLALVALLVVVVAAGGVLFFNNDAQPTSSPSTVSATSLQVSPGGVLLPSVGATKELTATAPDGGVPIGVTWTSSKPNIASVDSSGLVSAKAFGSTQVIARAGDLESAPVLVTVVAPAAGTVLVDDAQVIGDPVETNPDAPVTADSTYGVVLRDVSVAAGDLLLGTGEIPIGGRVVATAPSGSDTKVTLVMVSLPELLPNLEFDEVIDLSNAPIEFPPDVAANYDIARNGNTFTFTPKAAFDEQIKAATGTPRSVAGLLPDGFLASAGGPLYGVAVGTRALLPFQCEPEEEEDGTAPGILPFKLSEAPSFEITVSPALDVQLRGPEKRVIVDATPTITVKVGVKSTLAFSVSYECEVELWRFKVPAGWLALLVTGMIPVGVGFKLGGEVQLAEFGITYSKQASAQVRVGIDCPGGSCALVHEGNASPPVEPTLVIDAPSLADFRVKPAMELFGFIKMEIGNPLLRGLRLEAAEIKVGVKIAADWAPRIVQILDTGYSSTYGMTIELEAKAGPDLSDVAKRLGLDDILAVGLERSIDVIGSPAGGVSSDKDAYAAGDPGSATITLQEENLQFASFYVVDRVLLVSYINDEETILGSVTATAGQREFIVPFTAPTALAKSDLYAFVVPRLPGLDAIALELGRGAATSRIVFVRADPTTGLLRLFQVSADGTNEAGIDVNLQGVRGTSPIAVAPDGRIAFATSDYQLFIAAADGSDRRQLDTGDYIALYPAWSKDGSMLAFSGETTDPLDLITIAPDGAGLEQITSGEARDFTPAWSPDGNQITFARDIEGRGQGAVYVANADGAAARSITSPPRGASDGFPQWSPDGTKILFVRGRQGSGDIPTFNEIWVVNIDGSGERQLTFGPVDSGASWSPDGTKIVYSHSEVAAFVTGGQLWIMNADGTGAAALPTASGAVWPVWLGGP